MIQQDVYYVIKIYQEYKYLIKHVQIVLQLFDVYNASRTDNDSGLFLGFQKSAKTDPAKITVGFFSRFDPRANYWIVAAGTYADAIANIAIPTTDTTYDWAIISAGMPSKETSNGKCIPKPGIGNLYGMWMFTRDGVPPVGVMDGIDKIADNLGLDNKAWLPVKQEGCVF